MHYYYYSIYLFALFLIFKKNAFSIYKLIYIYIEWDMDIYKTI